MQKQLFELKKISLKIWLIGGLCLIGLFGLALSLGGGGGSKIKIAAEEAPQLAARIRKNFQMRNNYWGLDTAWVIRQQAAPLSMLDGDSLKNAIGKPVAVGNKDGSKLMPNARTFNIIYQNLNRSECVNLAAYKGKEENSLGLISMTVANGSEETEFSWGGTKSLPITANDAKNACKGQNTLIYTYE